MQIIRRAPRRGRGMHGYGLNRGYGVDDPTFRPGSVVSPGRGIRGLGRVDAGPWPYRLSPWDQGLGGPPRISDDDLLAAGSGGATRTADLSDLGTFVGNMREDTFVPNAPIPKTVADFPKNALPPQLTPSGVPGSTVTTVTSPTDASSGGSSRPSLLVMGGGALLFAGVGFWLLNRAG